MTIYDLVFLLLLVLAIATSVAAVVSDVFLVDSHWKRYDPILDGSEIPLNTLLQPGESVTTRRRFELPNDTQGIGLKVGYRTRISICLIIGECEAFHKGAIIRIGGADAGH